ncbi:subtilisin-like protein [Rozella allomycis CSF55]|uniref:Peptidase S8, subtilisin-related domain-containing protein n=1 Tax=Rozella allomycis (strain CSF55) TaxID=988480 RepID=A0A075AY95_ROZAC|nr:Peptidase S8, subtilisin-related domain-containing protein [Rozella allomycis CSF55]RKP18944.1 subtilisin-like protein [Rozella allomycis CSF55]|eukprot:EPZ35247.1 Peptidase S8, subtilisin-related domain-containing protein [Rozella allomycis CSF55]
MFLWILLSLNLISSSNIQKILLHDSRELSNLRKILDRDSVEYTFIENIDIHHQITYQFDFNAPRNIDRSSYINERSLSPFNISKPLLLERVKRGNEDPYFKYQWSYTNIGQYDESTTSYDYGLKSYAYLTGKNISIRIIDDGLDVYHFDLKHFNPDLSYNVNDKNYDLMPSDLSMNHGTRCVGQIIALPDNGYCIVGFAPEASVSFIKLLDKPHTDFEEAFSISYKGLHDIYSLSWGPPDYGNFSEGPGKYMNDAFERAIVQGRNKKGSIIIVAAGNGGDIDDCNYDGYVNDPRVIAVGAVMMNEKRPFYQERCSAMLITGYSGGYMAGIQNDPSSAQWQANAAGLKFHPYYAFGVLKANILFNMSQEWSLVGDQIILTESSYKSYKIAPLSKTQIYFKFSPRKFGLSCEKISITFFLQHPYPGMLESTIMSPHNTSSVIATRRVNDKNYFASSWTFSTPHFWGEFINGTWIFQIIDGRDNHEGDSGIIKDMSFQIYATDRSIFSSSSYPKDNQLDVFLAIGLLCFMIILIIYSRYRSKKKNNEGYKPLNSKPVNQSHRNSKMVKSKSLANIKLTTSTNLITNKIKKSISMLSINKNQSHWVDIEKQG